jgi:hypothetical protein
MDTNFGICEIPVLVYEYHNWYTVYLVKYQFWYTGTIFGI